MKLRYSFDRKNLDRALSNIILNSIKYNSPGITISIKLLIENEMAVIIIEDDGVGIPIEFQGDIFDPFVRVDTTRNSKSGGTGLGLAISKSIIEKHGGDINLVQDIDKGCKFIIKLKKTKDYIIYLIKEIKMKLKICIIQKVFSFICRNLIYKEEAISWIVKTIRGREYR